MRPRFNSCPRARTSRGPVVTISGAISGAILVAVRRYQPGARTHWQKQSGTSLSSRPVSVPTRIRKVRAWFRSEASKLGLTSAELAASLAPEEQMTISEFSDEEPQEVEAGVEE